MRHFRWPARSMAPLVVSLAALLAGCALGGSPGASTSSISLPAVLVSSVISAQNSTQFSTMRVAALDPSNGAVRWSYQASWHPWHPPSMPVVVNGIVYVTSDTFQTPSGSKLPPGYLTALSERDGHKLWSVQVGFLASTPVIANGVIYISGIHDNLVTTFYALRADSGQQIWHADVAKSPASSADITQGFGIFNTVQVVDGALYISSNQICFDYCSAAYLLALRASDGKRLWKVTIPGNLNIPTPAMGGGALYVMVPSVYNDSTNAMDPSQLVAYNTSDGTARWKIPAGPSRPLYVVGDTIYATSTVKDNPGDSNNNTFTITVKALDAATGATRWRFIAATHDSDTLLPLLGATADAVYVQSHSGGAYALSSLNPRDGSVRWQAPLRTPIGSQLLMNGSTLYALAGVLAQQASDHPYTNIIALDSASGHTLWSAPLSPAPRGDIPVAVLASGGGSLYAAYYANTLTAVRARDGATQWKAAISGRLVGVAVVV